MVKSLGARGELFQVSLSTMWAQGRFKHMAEFVEKARKFGFTQIEAHSSLSPKMLDELVKTTVPISSMHSPCPSACLSNGIPVSSLSLSSAEETERREAINYAKRTIDLASKIGAKVVVIHMGEVPVNAQLEEKLHRLYEEELASSEIYVKVKEELISERKSKAPSHLAAAVESLEELGKYGKSRRIMLGLENRVSFHEMPNIDEMEKLLSMIGNDSVGYWHDVGHAEVQQRLGSTPHEEWLLRFSHRMIGIHLHDVIGISDHQVPGKGSVNWGMVSEYLPHNAIRTCEVNQWNDAEMVREAVPFLQENGIIGRR